LADPKLRGRTNQEQCDLVKLGLICDIHEHIEHLQQSLDHFAACCVDRIVVIGDLFETGERIEELCRRLTAARVVGVWGNHDYGLCVDPEAATRAKYPSVVLDYMATLQPRLEIDDCYFTHVEPWLNPEDILDLWYYEGPPDEPEKIARIFTAVPHRVMFSGHYHRWLLATPDGISDWTGLTRICLAAARSFVVVGALYDGRFATFDTRTRDLVPFNLQDTPGTRGTP
jgi:hypothetical protein